MPSKRKAQKADPVLEAAVDYFAGRSHTAWRRQLLKTNPEQRGKPRMRERGGVMVDVNQPWSKLHAKVKADNVAAARAAYAAVKRFPNDREAAADYVHKAWIRRNKADKSQPKDLFKPYAKLPEVEKDKDRAHVDNMKKAIAAVTRKKPRAKPKAKRAPAARTVNIDARTWARLEAAARDLSRALGRKVPPEALVSAGVKAVASLCRSVAADARRKKR